MKTTHIALAVAFVVCAGLLLFVDRTPPDQVVEAAPHAGRSEAPAAAAANRANGADGTPAATVILALRPRAELFHETGGGRHELFGSQSWAPALPSMAPANAQIPPLPPIPAEPVLPFTYLGKKLSGGTWEVYLARGDETLIVHDQMLIDSMYRVESIKPPTLTLVYLPKKAVQTIDIGSAD
ncbi:hypothetical protein [Paraburkholderia rhizosphaerae]|uniref:Prolin-rich transmembrane protein n=1 Tax=Paraburkholderia rhizosphaerae TaxID=480658 RepID=A0A4R8LIA2_9BURK|nr:hypothetical protein [Paraburkholderia rhizosphaerae]TDY43014.1 hypothetical protein BX592_119132 [Paraburkholderia rhizosphaerae]